MQQSEHYGTEPATAARARVTADLEKLLASRGASEHRDAVDSTLSASGALFAAATRSIADVLELVSLPEYSVMLALASGPLSIDDLGTHPEVAPRTLDEALSSLLDGGWVGVADPKTPTFELSAHGAQLMAQVGARRRAEISSILETLPHRDQVEVARAFTLFSEAVSESRPHD